MTARKSFDPLLLGLLVLSLALNVFQAFGFQSRYLAAETSAGLSEGDRVPDISGHDLDGRPARFAIGESDRPTVLYVFSQECPWCLRNTQNLKALVGAISERYQMVGLALDDDPNRVRHYLDKLGLFLPATVLVDPRTRRAYQLGRTPTTILVSPGGKVTRVWLGAFSGHVGKSVSQTFGVTLPGVTPEQ
jgi:hypothetical protein